jgi:ABC-type dipeptide/oligopeptide/nickel transport systems, permease components
MAVYILRRLIQTIPVMLGVTIVVFLIMQLVPGDPARLLAGEGATPEQIEAIRVSLGLDKSLIEQYLKYLSQVLQGDLGKSMVTNAPVLEEIMIRLPTTVELACASIFVAVTLGLLAGIVSATKQNTWADMSLMVVALIGVSMPSFWMGLMLMYYFSVELGLFPVAGWGSLAHMVLPAITLGSGGAAIIARMTRSSMLEVIRQDYIRTARAKGVSEFKIVFKHALKNALIPIITVVGLQFGTLLGGTVITESVFAINGVGQLVINAIRTRDLPMVQGIVLMVSMIFMLVNMGVDILYRTVNKRVELE